MYGKFIFCVNTYISFISKYHDTVPIIERKGVVGIPLTGLTLPHICACPKPEAVFPTSYVALCSIFSELR